MESTQTEITLGFFNISEIRRPGAIIIELGSNIFLTMHVKDSSLIDKVGINTLIKLKAEIPLAESSQPPIE